jgi:hypothetical protein
MSRIALSLLLGATCTSAAVSSRSAFGTTLARATRGGSSVSMDGALPRVFFDVEIGGQAAGRVVFELFSDVVPKTATNFLKLCTAEQGPEFAFAGSPFHRIIPGFSTCAVGLAHATRA